MSTEKEKPPDIAKTPFSAVFAWLGEHRDGFLVGGAVLYGVGYLVWSYNAWKNHLGQLPAAEFQYLVAGIIPMILIALAWAGAVFFYNMREKANASLRWGWLPRMGALLAAIILVVGYTVVRIISSKKWIDLGLDIENVFRYGFPVIMVIVFLLFLSSTRQHSRTKAPGLTLMAIADALYRYIFPVLFCWLSLNLYLDLYPRLPQELGGPQPRCAYVDLVRDNTALSTLSALAPGDFTQSSASSDPKVVRSKKLNVYFSSSDYLLVRIADDAATDGANLKDVPLYELRKDVIRVVEWCR